MEKNITILGICGSLRRDSFNRALLNYAATLEIERIKIKIADISNIPNFNQDMEKQMPESVKVLKDEIKNADAVLISTPEYNRSIPGVLKNAIDWASRPYGENVFDEKPVATMGATVGAFVGTAIVQYHLREIFSFLNAHPLEKPQLFVANAPLKIKDGKVIDDDTKELIKEVVVKLAEWAKRINQN
jgi:chromate reductase